MSDYLVEMCFRGNNAPHRYYLLSASCAAAAETEASRRYSREGPMRLDCYPDAVALPDGFGAEEAPTTTREWRKLATWARSL